ncbi:MAG: hypothetical protein LAN62_07330 [Acidobacteriia bacterium]|nr:hypothetical protein [Terriglobia bacterium]
MLGTLICLANTAALAQQDEVQIDWPSRSLTYSPPTINEITKVRVTVRNVNDLLYSYKARVAATPRATDLFSPEVIQTLSQRVTSPAGKSCDSSWDPFSQIFSKIQANLITNRELNPIVPKDPNNPIPKPRDGEPRSVALLDSVQTWNTFIQPDANQAQALTPAVKRDCANDATKMNAVRDFEFVTNKWSTMINSPHDFIFGTTLAPDNDYCVYIAELFQDVKTSIGEQKFCFSPSSTLISLSGGYLYTELAGRTYDRQSVPEQTDAQLVVNQSGPVRPVFTSLVNVEIPFLNDFGFAKRGKLGFAISIGPVLQTGTGSENASKIGLFGGFSIHFGHRFYLTPGVHVGEFADFPPGFPYSGKSIPSTFTGPLTPVKRNTARFGLAVTFKGFDLKKSQSKPTSGSSSQSKTTSGSSSQPKTSDSGAGR